MRSPARVAVSCAAVLLAACAAAPPQPKSQPTGAPRSAPAAAPRDKVTAAAIERVLSGEHRSAANRARDPWRHPLDTLLFFGIKPDMTVVEVWPGAGGWYTEVLAPLLAGQGKLYVAQDPGGSAQCIRERNARCICRQARGTTGSLRQGHRHDAGSGRR